MPLSPVLNPILNGLSDPVIDLDEVAIRATISILAGYITRFLKEQEFRTTLRFSCFSSLDSMDSEECHDAESKVISNLKQAIEVVEEAAEELRSVRDLKKSLLQLSVITSLNSDDLKDAFTCGIPNSMLSAIVHLYLSVIYKIQKKDRVSAKHLLQVFADSPLQARTIWLPDLWEALFYPHLSDLKMWHSQEVESLLTLQNYPFITLHSPSPSTIHGFHLIPRRASAAVANCTSSGNTGSGGLKEVLSGLVDTQVEELSSREENRELLDGLDRASARVEEAKRDLAALEEQKSETRQLRETSEAGLRRGAARGADLPPELRRGMVAVKEESKEQEESREKEMRYIHAKN